MDKRISIYSDLLIPFEAYICFRSFAFSCLRQVLIDLSGKGDLGRKNSILSKAVINLIQALD